MKTKLTTLSALGLVTFLSNPAYAEQAVDNAAVLAKLEELQKEVNTLKSQLAAKEAIQVQNLEPAAGPARTAQENANAQEIALLKRKLEVKEEIETSNSQKFATVQFDKKGLVIQSPDKKIQLSAKGYAQVDSRQFFNDDDNFNKGDFLLRRARPVIEGKLYDDFSFRFMPDFAGSSSTTEGVARPASTTRIFDAHVDYKLWDDAVQLRFGKFKPPIGLERLQSATGTFFIERGHPTNLAPNRDIGFQVYGTPIPELEYQAGIFNGTEDLGNLDGDDDDNKDFAGRIFVTPFAQSETVDLQGLGFGVGGSIGKHEGNTANRILPTYHTPTQAGFFSYDATAFADGTNWRLYPQAYWFNNNYGILGEYALSSQEVREGAVREEILNKAWQLEGSFVLTGENVNFKGGVVPDEPFDPSANQWGAFEAVARVGGTYIDDQAFDSGFASRATSADTAFTAGVGVDWYLNDNFKWLLDYENTSFDGGLPGDDRGDENAVLPRWQFKF